MKPSTLVLFGFLAIGLVAVGAFSWHAREMRNQQTSYENYILMLQTAYVSMIDTRPLSDVRSEIRATALLRLNHLEKDSKGSPLQWGGTVYPKDFYAQSKATLQSGTTTPSPE